MTTLLFAISALFGFGMVLVVARALIGPTLFDRLLATNVIGTLVVIMLVILSLAMRRPDFVDLALLYAMLNFIGMIAVLKYVRFGHLGHSKTEQNYHNPKDYQHESIDTQAPQPHERDTL